MLDKTKSMNVDDLANELKHAVNAARGKVDHLRGLL